MEIQQYLSYIITAIPSFYMNRLKILDFSLNNKIGKWTVGLIMLPIMFPIAIYKIHDWIKNDASFRKIYEMVIYQKKITDYFIS
jgi:hypothetical protein